MTEFEKNLEYEVVVEENEVHPNIINLTNFLLFIGFIFLLFLLQKIYNEYKREQLKNLYTKLNLERKILKN